MEQTKPTKPATQENYFSTYLSVAIPLMVSYLSVTFIALGDTVMVNWLGKAYCSEASMANLIFAIPCLFIIGFTSILPPLVAASSETKDYRNATDKLIHLLFINLFFAAATLLFLLGISKKLIISSVSDMIYYPDAVAYFRLIVVSIIPYSFLLTLKRYMQSIGGRWRHHVMALDILAGLCNLFLNYVFIYGRWGAPTLGMAGAGWATLLTRCLFLCINIGYLFAMYQKGYLSFDHKPWRMKRSAFKTILHLGLPSAMELTLRMFYMAAGSYIIKDWYGESLHAASSVLLQASRIALMIPLGVSIAASILVARAHSRQDPIYLRKISAAGYKVGFVLITLTALLFSLLAPYCIRLLIREPQVRLYAYEMVGLTIIFNMCDGLNIISSGMLRGIKDTFLPFLSSTFNYLIIGLPTCYLAAYRLGWGVPGVWVGLTVGYGMNALVLAARFFYKTRPSK